MSLRGARSATKQSRALPDRHGVSEIDHSPPPSSLTMTSGVDPSFCLVPMSLRGSPQCDETRRSKIASTEPKLPRLSFGEPATTSESRPFTLFSCSLSSVLCALSFVRPVCCRMSANLPRRHAVKKLPIIGLVIGAIAAGFAIMKRKKSAPSTEDTTPPPGA
jgi:hypothetical protein